MPHSRLPGKFLIKFRETRVLSRGKVRTSVQLWPSVTKWCYIIIGNNSRYFNFNGNFARDKCRAEWNLRASLDICPVSYASALVIVAILSPRPFIPLKHLWVLIKQDVYKISLAVFSMYCIYCKFLFYFVLIYKRINEIILSKNKKLCKSSYKFLIEKFLTLLLDEIRTFWKKFNLEITLCSYMYFFFKASQLQEDCV